ncbi:MAG: hypothetical protein IJT19_00560 [Bacteroidaceae bacterium]|nr:hypothetical protein [Bacteroidaceae bacterium]
MEYEKLCRAVEQHLHREMHTPADFDYLSEQILSKTGSSVSSATLMRLWGYRPSVTVRVSTLDILARFIGYNDYTHFRTENPEEEENPALAPASDTRRRWPRYMWPTVAMTVIILLASVVGFYIKGNSQPQEQQQPKYITNLSELKNNRQYLIHTREQRRGSLGVCGHHLGATFERAVLFHCDKPAPFAIIRHEGSFYLFSVESCRFVNILNCLTDEPLRKDFGERNWCAFDIHQEKKGFVFDFKAATNVYTLNVPAFDGILFDEWGTANGFYDDGNQFTLEDVGPFDPTVPLTMLQQTPTK